MGSKPGKIEIVIDGGSQWLVPGETVKGFINIKTEAKFESDAFVFSLIGMEHCLNSISTGDESPLHWYNVDKVILNKIVISKRTDGFAP